MTHLDYLNENYPVRKSQEQKKAFRDYILDDLTKKGINASVEKTSDGKNDNIVIGDPEKAEVVYVAHYDTPARSLFPNIMIPKNKLVFYAYQFVPVVFLLAVSLIVAYIVGIVLLNDTNLYMLTFLVLYYGMFFLIMRGFPNPYNYNDNTSGVATVLSIIDGLNNEEREKAAFILFDNEEKGKKGSLAFYKDHKAFMQDKFLVNFDCVGNGDNIIFIAQGEAAKSRKFKLLEDSFIENDGFTLDFCTYKEGSSNSDHKNFPKGVACVACKKKGNLLYTPNIHTKRDTVVNNSNIDFLAKNICKFTANIR